MLKIIQIQDIQSFPSLQKQYLKIVVAQCSFLLSEAPAFL